MSSLIGTPGESWSLARAIDAMGAAARQVGRPGLVWLLGAFYPGAELAAGYGLLSLLLHSDAPRTVEDRVIVLSSLAVYALLAPRISAGLARVTTPEAWQELSAGRVTPRLRDVWRASSGLGWPTFGLWLDALAMLVIPAFVVLAPPLYLLEHFQLRPGDFTESGTFLCALVLGPFAAVVLAFGLVLSVLQQLALQSLVHNQRGIGSALLHAWRIARHDPWSTARAVLVDLVAMWTALAVWFVAWVALPLWAFGFCCLSPVLVGAVLLKPAWFKRTGRIVFGLLLLLVPGLIGVVRAAYWSRVYRALGGLAPSDSVPGLSSKVVEPPSS